jgi:hypothetical protein
MPLKKKHQTLVWFSTNLATNITIQIGIGLIKKLIKE